MQTSQRVRRAVLIGFVALGSACAQMGGAESGSAETLQSNERMLVYKARGSVQCEGRGVAPEIMAADLVREGIAVQRYACAHDGRMRTAQCGGSTGELNVFEIFARDANKARAQGFHTLQPGMDSPVEVQCR